MNEVTADLVRERLHYDTETGVFKWRIRPCRNVKAGAIAGRTDHEGYRTISINSRQYKAHRIAWLYMTGSWPTLQIDHRDGVRDNNRWCNLREATPAMNSQNKRRGHGKCGLLGVAFHKKAYQAHIGIGGKTKYIGRFNTAEEAYAAYLKVKRELHEGNTL